MATRVPSVSSTAVESAVNGGATAMSQCSTFWISGIRASKNARVSARVLNIFQFPAIMGRLILLAWGVFVSAAPYRACASRIRPRSVLLFDQASAGPPHPLVRQHLDAGTFLPGQKFQGRAAAGAA